jgi:hypothetical protein
MNAYRCAFECSPNEFFLENCLQSLLPRPRLFSLIDDLFKCFFIYDCMYCFGNGLTKSIQRHAPKKIEAVFMPVSGWPDRANFRLQVDCFLWSVFRKLRTEAKFFSTFFYAKSCPLILTKKVGLATFWAIFFTDSSGHPGPSVSLSGYLWTSLSFSATLSPLPHSPTQANKLAHEQGDRMSLWKKSAQNIAEYIFVKINS